DKGLEVDGADLGGHLVQHLTAFWLKCRLIEAEEGVCVEDDLGCGGRIHGCLLSNGNAVAARNTGSRGPEVVAPAQFTGAVLPNITVWVLPVIDGLCRNSARSRNGCDGERYCEFGGFIPVSPRLSIMPLNDRSEPP